MADLHENVVAMVTLPPILVLVMPVVLLALVVVRLVLCRKGFRPLVALSLAVSPMEVLFLVELLLVG